MDRVQRNTLRNVVTQCRRLLEDAIRDVLEGQFGISASGKVEDISRMGHLSQADLEYRVQLLAHLQHIQAFGFKAKDSVAQLIREVAFTHLNRFCAYKMMETRGLIREAVSRGPKSQGFVFYLADHKEDEALWLGGQQDVAYCHFLEWLGGTLSEEIGVLFSPRDPANRLFPPEPVLEKVLAFINSNELREIWSEDEAIGWIYQYFTPKEIRDQARKESQSPRNSYELAFRNQFYTPRYVVEFLTDNTLGRRWYEMRKGHTRLAEQCRYLVRRKHAVFLSPGKREPEAFDPSSQEVDFETRSEMWTRPNPDLRDINDLWKYALTVDGYGYARQHFRAECGDLANERIANYHNTKKWDGTFEELRCCLFFEQRRYHHFGEGPKDESLEAIEDLYQAICERWNFETEFVLHRVMKDPREIKILDPACGSGHFLLYCFDLLEVMYEEAYEDADLGARLKRDFSSLAELKKAVPGLILAENLHGIDIDLRATQIAALALWLRAQRAYQDMGFKGTDRPTITKSNIVCAEPMPGEEELLKEFAEELQPKVLGQITQVIFSKTKLAGEAGSLLTINEDLKMAISEAKRQWLTKPKSEQLTLWPEEKRPQAEQLALFDVSGITDEEFWNEIEERVLGALRDYAGRAANGKGLLRRLFADDAVHGFAFVDICRKSFDVVLMNPPFGEPTENTRELIKLAYPSSAANLFAAFVLRARNMGEDVVVGAITDSTWLKKEDYFQLRSTLVGTRDLPSIMCDLGWGILDANVATCAFILSHGSSNSDMLTFRLVDLDADIKADRLEASIHKLHTSPVQLTLYGDCPIVLRSWDFFERFPHYSLAYETPTPLVAAFEKWQSLEPNYAIARRGYTPGDTFRFFRCWWEVPNSERGGKWRTLNNGSAYAPVLGQGFFVAFYEDGWQQYKANSGFRLESEAWFGKPGLGYGKRTEFMYAYPLPAQAMFSNEGHTIFPDDANYWEILGYLNSIVCQSLINLYCGQHKTAGYVSKVPTPDPDIPAMKQVGQIAKDIWFRSQIALTRDETLEQFVALLYPLNGEGIFSIGREMAEANHWYQTKLTEIDACVLSILVSDGKSFEDSQNLLTANRPIPSLSTCLPSSSSVLNSPLYPGDLMQYAVGCAFGRWDIRASLEPDLFSPQKDPAMPLPHCPPGMLVGTDGLPSERGGIVSEEWLSARRNDTDLPSIGPNDRATVPDLAYPLRIAWDGILVDDVDNLDDIVRNLQEVVNVLWNDSSEPIEQDICGILGIRSLRDYFRRAGNGGFWMDHVKRYSKGRRKAPIYWLLQSSEKNYALWLYYHRLDKDLLYKALVKYVEPKIRLEEDRLTRILNQRAGAGTAGQQVKELERQHERQEEFLSELRDFADKLRRAADLHLGPDLNDGVVLNIAPLWELVPWKEAKTYWDELLAGKYEWSSIGKQLRDRGLVKENA